MRYRGFFIRCLFAIFATCASLMIVSLPARAASIDPYVIRYLKVTDPVSLEMNSQGETRLFSAEELSTGKHLFEESCINCHVGGATLPDPQVSLSLEDLKGATPPRDNINALVAYLRQPMTYDGSEDTFWCRDVPESWMSQEQIENLGAFLLRAAQNAPGWGTQNFDI